VIIQVDEIASAYKFECMKHWLRRSQKSYESSVAVENGGEHGEARRRAKPQPASTT